MPEAEPPSDPDAAPRRVSRRASIVGSAIALLVLAGIGALAWWLTQGNAAGSAQPRAGGPGAGRRGPAAITVGVAQAERVDLPVLIEGLGTVTPIATATVRPQVSGPLRELLFKEGQMVKAGQVIAQIDPRPFEIAVMQATGQRMKDEAQLDNAKITLERYRTLLAQDSIARQDVDTQAALVKQLEASVVSDRAAEATAKLNLGYTRITAPIGGRVGLRVVDVGNLVSTNDAQGVAVITQLAPIDVEFSIAQDLLPELRSRLAEGAKLPVDALDRSRSTVLDSGTFVSLDNQVDIQTGTVRAKARFANTKNALFPNQFVNVRMQLRTIEGAVVVPVSALRHGSIGDFVFVVNPAERTVALRRVSAGQLTGDKVQIAKGVNAGETVVTEGADRLQDGARVTLPGDVAQAGGQGAAGAKGAPGGRSEGRGGGRAGRGPASADGEPMPEPARAPSDGQTDHRAPSEPTRRRDRTPGGEAQ